MHFLLLFEFAFASVSNQKLLLIKLVRSLKSKYCFFNAVFSVIILNSWILIWFSQILTILLLEQNLCQIEYCGAWPGQSCFIQNAWFRWKHDLTEEPLIILHFFWNFLLMAYATFSQEVKKKTELETGFFFFF